MRLWLENKLEFGGKRRVVRAKSRMYLVSRHSKNNDFVSVYRKNLIRYHIMYGNI